MTIDNANYSVKVKLLRLALLLVTASLIIINSMQTELDEIIGFNHNIISFVILGLYVVYNVYRYAKEYNFILMSTEVGKLTIKFYQLITFGKKAKIFDFPLAEFYKYEISKHGLKTFLIIYRRQDKQIVKYPQICINSLKKSEIEKITKTLDNIKLY